MSSISQYLWPNIPYADLAKKLIATNTLSCLQESLLINKTMGDYKYMIDLMFATRDLSYEQRVQVLQLARSLGPRRPPAGAGGGGARRQFQPRQQQSDQGSDAGGEDRRGGGGGGGEDRRPPRGPRQQRPPRQQRRDEGSDDQQREHEDESPQQTGESSPAPPRPRIAINSAGGGSS